MASSTAKKLTVSTPLQFLKGIGPAKASAFARKGIVTLQDALYYFPRRYEDRKRLCEPRDLATLPEGLQVTVMGRIERHREIPLHGRKQTLFEMIVMGEQGDLLTCTWFHVYKGLKEKLTIGSWGIFQGALKKYKGAPQIVHPDVEVFKEKPKKVVETPISLHWGRIVPIYSRSEKLTQKFIREVLRNCLDLGLPLLPDLLPKKIRDKFGFPGIAQALEEMHFPKEIPLTEAETTEALPAAIRRLIFEEFFKFQLLLLMDRSGVQKEKSIPLEIKGQLAQKLRNAIPYSLTKAQEKAIIEVREDLQKSTAMNRIVQGDVGSGKTFVAFITACEALENEMQVALMAPTEILAEQHYLNAKKLFADTGVNVILLTGSLSKAEKEKAQEEVRSGRAGFVIGTHALIQDAVDWHKLGLAIIDEQHRFGVRQRTALKEKTKNYFPHILTMTATPIPRSLALTVFGELDVSTIDELPPGRQEIVTKVLRGADRMRLYAHIHREVAEKRQAYIVYPLVYDSDKEGMEKVKSVEAECVRLKEGPLAGLRVAMVHGQMKSEERNAIMRAFKNHEFDVLVSTTVIEVGVDVPNATVIAIENAERFGLSQLHQLRGRVGRGSHKSYCVLITDSAPPGTRTAVTSAEEGVEDESPWVRLLALEKSSNGFEIAEQDLKLRGPGDFFGTKQSGSPTFQLADLSRDAGLLELARQEAKAIYAEDPKLEQPGNEALGAWFRQVLDEASVSLKSG